MKIEFYGLVILQPQQIQFGKKAKVINNHKFDGVTYDIGQYFSKKKQKAKFQRLSQTFASSLEIVFEAMH